MAAAKLQLHLAGGQIQFIVRHQDLTGLYLEESRQGRYRFARQVHIGHGLQQPHWPRGRVGSGGQSKVATLGRERHLQLTSDRIHQPKTGVVARILIFRAGVAKAYKQSNHGEIIEP